MRIVLAHSHANTLGGGERAILELARALLERHEVRLLLGGFDPRRTYPELASLPHAPLGRLQWPIAQVTGDAIVANSFGANLLSLRNGPRVAYWVHSTRSVFLQPGDRRLDVWRDVPDLPLHVVGSGLPEIERELRARAPSGVFFRGHLTSADLASAYRGAAASVFAPYGEEFGMAPLESR